MASVEEADGELEESAEEAVGELGEVGGLMTICRLARFIAPLKQKVIKKKQN